MIQPYKPIRSPTFSFFKTYVVGKMRKKWLKTRRLLGLDCKGERRKKGSKLFGKKEKELIGFLKREFNIGYHVVEAKCYHKISKWLGG